MVVGWVPPPPALRCQIALLQIYREEMSAVSESGRVYCAEEGKKACPLPGGAGRSPEPPQERWLSHVSNWKA